MGDRTELETLYHERAADGVVIVTLNRPDHGNGVVAELAQDLVDTLTACEGDRSVRCLVLTGAGKQFCAGADLKAMRRYIREELPRTQEPFTLGCCSR